MISSFRCRCKPRTIVTFKGVHVGIGDRVYELNLWHPGCFWSPESRPISFLFLHGHNHFSPKGCFSPLPAWQAVFYPKFDSGYSNQGFSLLASAVSELRLLKVFQKQIFNKMLVGFHCTPCLGNVGFHKAPGLSNVRFDKAPGLSNVAFH